MIVGLTSSDFFIKILPLSNLFASRDRAKPLFTHFQSPTFDKRQWRGFFPHPARWRRSRATGLLPGNLTSVLPTAWSFLWPNTSVHSIGCTPKRSRARCLHAVGCILLQKFFGNKKKVPDSAISAACFSGLERESRYCHISCVIGSRSPRKCGLQFTVELRQSNWLNYHFSYVIHFYLTVQAYLCLIIWKILERHQCSDYDQHDQQSFHSIANPV